MEPVSEGDHVRQGQARLLERDSVLVHDRVPGRTPGVVLARQSQSVAGAAECEEDLACPVRCDLGLGDAGPRRAQPPA